MNLLKEAEKAVRRIKKKEKDCKYYRFCYGCKPYLDYSKDRCFQCWYYRIIDGGKGRGYCMFLPEPLLTPWCRVGCRWYRTNPIYPCSMPSEIGGVRV